MKCRTDSQEPAGAEEKKAGAEEKKKAKSKEGTRGEEASSIWETNLHQPGFVVCRGL